MSIWKQSMYDDHTINNGPFGPFGAGFRNLKPGDRGADVLAVEERLKELSYYERNLSGIYGEGI